MAATIATSRTISGDTFYKNKDFDISFAVASAVVSDTCLYFGNSTYGVLPYVNSAAYTFRAASNTITTVGSLGTLSVDVVALNPVAVASATAPSYLAMTGMASDSSGNVYFAVANQHSIFRRDLSGTVALFAGTGIAGDTNGARLSAQFRAPAGLAFDGSGTLYVTDQYRVRKIANDTVSTLAGSSTSGYVDSSGANARFAGPGAVVVRPTGALLVSESDSHRIRNVTQTGIVTTYAGNGTAGYRDGIIVPLVLSNILSGPRAVGASGVFDTRDGLSWTTTSITLSNAKAIRTVTDASGVLTRILYGGQNNFPYTSTILYQSDPCGALQAATGSALYAVNEIQYDGTSRYVAGGETVPDGPLIYSSNGLSWSNATTPGTFSVCKSLAYGNSKWVAAMSSGSGNPYYISTTGSNWTSSIGVGLSAPNVVRYGGGMWVAAGVASSYPADNLAYQTDASLTTAPFWFPATVLGGETVSALEYGNGVWVVGRGASNSGVPLQYSTDAITWTDCSVETTPGAVASITYSARLGRWIATYSDTPSLLTTSTDGSNWTTSSSPTSSILYAMTDVSWSRTDICLNGTAEFQFPYGMVYDTSGTLYIADQYNHRIRAVSNGGTTVTTYAGSGVDGNSSGPRLSAAISRPANLARDPATGVIYIGSFDRHDIRTLTSTTVSPYAGTWGSPGFLNGYAPTAKFNGPQGMTVVGSNLYVADFYNSLARVLTNYPDVRPGVDRLPVGGTIIATSNYPITINSRIDVCWTSVGGVIPLYKFEPFSNNSFTANRCGGSVLYGTNDILTYATSSTELASFLTGTGTTSVLFRGSNGPSVAYTYPLTLSVRAVSNVGSVQTIVDDISTTVTLNPARIIYSPCNASLVFYRNEPVSPTTFSLVASDVCLIYSATSLPTGLAFTRTDPQSFALTGTPTVQTITSNYTILAFDTATRTYATKVSIVVNPERLLLDVSGSLTQTGLLTTSPMAPITFSARFPPYGLDRSMRYTWSPPPPAGLQFRNRYGVPISGSSYPVDLAYDPSFSLTLAGTITEAQLQVYASNNLSSYSITVTGTRTSPLPTLSPSLPRTITLSFGETILFTPTVPALFRGLTISNTYFYSAKTHFASIVDTSITNIAVTDGFLPDGLAGQFIVSRQRYEISGTPVTAATFPFTLTATNGAGTTASLSVAPTISNDSVTLIAGQADTCYNFIQSRDLSNPKTGFYPSPIRYSVASASGRNVTVTGTTLPAGVTIAAGTGNAYDFTLVGRPTTATVPSVISLANLTARVPATGVSNVATFAYTVSAETFTFPSLTFAFRQNVPSTPVQIDVSTLSETSVTRFSSPSIPAALEVTNIGLVRGTLAGSNDGTFDVTAFTPYTSGTKTYSYTVTPDKVLLQASVAQTTTAAGCNVSIPINGYSLSSLTVSNFRFQDPFPYGLTVNPTTGLLSGTLSSSLPTFFNFSVLGNAGTVVGSLLGQMQTTGQTRLAVNLIEMQDQSNLRVYSSTDGLVWGSAIVSSNTMAAARIGINGAGTFLIPTSSDTLLRSTSGTSYSNLSLGQSAQSPLMTGIVYDASSSTWWIAGTLLSGTRSVRVFKSTDDGLTWDAGTTVSGVQDRSGNLSPGAGVYDAYLYGGVDLAYRNGVLLLGGQQIARSLDGGATWATSPSSLIEVARFSLDQGEVWLAIGSSLYSSLTANTYTADATTIVYSLDQGLTWDPAPGGFTMNAYEIVYGNGVWLASGLDWTGSAFVERIRYSFDGLTWTVLTSIPSATYASTLDVRPLGLYGAISYRQSTWTVVVPDGLYPSPSRIWTHPGDTPINTGWTYSETGPLVPIIGPPTRRYSSIVGQTADSGPDITIITFPVTGGGPTFISPAQSTYAVWQYMPIPPITFTATGLLPVTSYFISSLPVGLTWNSATRTVSGACMRTGTQTFTVYAIFNLPTPLPTPFTVTLIVDVPRIVRQQTGAGAYTALVRDYTEVAAAINARDTRVNPTEEAALGSFASPYAPDVVTPSNCPC